MPPLVRLLELDHPKCSHVAVWREGQGPNGRLLRRRKYFSTGRKARAWVRTKEVELMRGQLHEAPVTAAELSAVYQARKTIGAARLREAIELLATKDGERGRNLTVATLVDKRLAAVEAAERSMRHVGDLKTRLGRLKERFGKLLVSDLSADRLSEWLLTLPVGPGTRTIYRRRVVSLFTWAMKRGLASGNPGLAVELPAPPPKRPGILTVDEATTLLSKAPPALLPALAIGLFAGLRRSEVERLTWDRVSLERGHLEVFGKKTNTPARRLVTIQPSLKAFLLPYARATGKVVPGSVQDTWREFQRGQPIGRPWPNNALRHSFCSYHLAHFKDAALTALEMGHRTTDMIFEHYRELVTPAAAASFWSLRPKRADSRPGRRRCGHRRS